MGVDLGDYYTGALSLRRLRILVKYLPGEAKLAKLIRARRRAAGFVDEGKIEDADPSVWSQTDWLLVHIDDQLTLLNHAFRSVHRDPKKRPPPPPAFLPRPGAEKPRRKTLNAWFGAVGLAPPMKPVHA
jgi:hypothetical protein